MSLRLGIGLAVTLGLVACSVGGPAAICGTSAPVLVLPDTRLQKLAIGDGDADTPLTEADLVRYDSLTDGTSTGALPEQHGIKAVELPGIGRKGTGLRPNKQQARTVAADPGLIREHLPILHAGTRFATTVGPWRWGLQSGEPPTVDLRSQMPAVRDQGPRNTCYAFSLAAVLDHAAARIPEARIKAASPQFLYWRYEAEIVSQLSPPDLWLEEGMDPLVAWVLLHPQGVTRGPRRPAIPGDRGYVSEANAPYQSQPQALAADVPIDVASRTILGPLTDRIAAGECLSSQGATIVPLKNDTATLRLALSEGLPVIVGFPLYGPDWRRTADADVIPELRPEVLAETGGHAVVLVGYQDDATAPGGGYFLMRNSWGPEWGDRGHARVSYAMTQQWGLDPQVILAVSDTFSGRYGLNKPS